jgi:lipopolysaccharide export system protein LptA
MTTVESSLEQFPISSKLEMAHDQATEVVDQVENASDQAEMENYTFEPLIAGDFPTMRKPVAPKKEKKKKENLDLSSESAFPSLSSSGSRPPAVSCWSSPASRVKSQPTQPIRSTATSSVIPNVKKSNATQITDILEISADKQVANLPERPANFKGNTEIIQDVMSRTGTNIITSTNLSGTSTYLIQGSSSDVTRAKRELLANITIKVSERNGWIKNAKFI